MAKKKIGKRTSSESIVFRVTDGQREVLNELAKILDLSLTDTLKTSIKELAEKKGLKWPPTKV